MKIDPKYIVDESNRKIAVQLDMKTFEKIEEILENYGLVQLMSSEDSKETLDLDQARSYYKSLEKAEWMLFIKRNFSSSLRKYHPPREIKIEKFAFEDLPVARSIAELGVIEKMQGYDAFYKARFGSYRIGIKTEGDHVILKVVMDRKEIYKFFP